MLSTEARAEANLGPGTGPLSLSHLPCRDPQHFPGLNCCRHCAKKSQRFSLEEAFRESFSREDILKQFQIVLLEATLGEAEVTSWSLPACSEWIAVALTYHMQHMRKIMMYSYSHLKRHSHGVGESVIV